LIQTIVRITEVTNNNVSNLHMDTYVYLS
jgi:hypothetical protein